MPILIFFFLCWFRVHILNNDQKMKEKKTQNTEEENFSQAKRNTEYRKIEYATPQNHYQMRFIVSFHEVDAICCCFCCYCCCCCLVIQNGCKRSFWLFMFAVFGKFSRTYNINYIQTSNGVCVCVRSLFLFICFSGNALFFCSIFWGHLWQIFFSLTRNNIASTDNNKNLSGFYSYNNNSNNDKKYEGQTFPTGWKIKCL